MLVELIGGWLAASLALLADAAHMLADVAALGLALIAAWIAQRPATPERSFGFMRLEILAALINGAVLFAIAIGIGIEAWHRLNVPQLVNGPLVLGVAAVGFVANLAAVVVLHRGHEHSLNQKGAYLHVLGDLLGSVGALVAGVIVLTSGWMMAYPLISVLIGALVLVSAWRLVKERDRKSTRLNSSHGYISYAVFCLKKKTREVELHTRGAGQPTAHASSAHRRE